MNIKKIGLGVIGLCMVLSCYVFADVKYFRISHKISDYGIIGEDGVDPETYTVMVAGEYTIEGFKYEINKDGYEDLYIMRKDADYCFRIYGKAPGLEDFLFKPSQFYDFWLKKVEKQRKGKGYSGVNLNTLISEYFGEKQGIKLTGSDYDHIKNNVNGGFERFQINLSSLTSAQGFKVCGGSSDDQNSNSVSSVDVNGDGFKDVIFGAPGPSSNAGTSYVIFGKTSGFSDINLSTLTAAEGFRILGESNDDDNDDEQFGTANGDQESDMICERTYYYWENPNVYAISSLNEVTTPEEEKSEL